MPSDASIKQLINTFLKGTGEIDLSDKGLTDAQVIRAVIPALRGNKFRSLNLSRNNLFGDCVAALSELKVERMNLSDNNIEDAVALVENEAITSLDLTENMLDKASIEAVFSRNSKHPHTQVFMSAPIEDTLRQLYTRLQAKQATQSEIAGQQVLTDYFKKKCSFRLSGTSSTESSIESDEYPLARP